MKKKSQFKIILAQPRKKPLLKISTKSKTQRTISIKLLEIVIKKHRLKHLKREEHHLIMRNSMKNRKNKKKTNLTSKPLRSKKNKKSIKKMRRLSLQKMRTLMLIIQMMKEKNLTYRYLTYPLRK